MNVKHHAIIILILAGVLIIGCLPGDPESILVNELEVYRQIISQHSVQEGNSLLMITKETANQQFLEETLNNNQMEIQQLIQEMPLILPETTEDFWEVNATVYELNDFEWRELQLPYQLVASSKIARLWRNNGEDEDEKCKALQRSYPKATDLYRFSRVGFNSERIVEITQALVYVEHLCSAHEPEYMFVLLTTDDSESWYIEQELEVVRTDL